MPSASEPDGWRAELSLQFARDGERTMLAARKHTGPLRVQKALHPEGPGVCQALIIHPPGGIVEGDSLLLTVDAGPGAHAQLTTPGAAKWYRSTGRHAVSAVRLALGHGSIVEWLPQETILFDGARASISNRITMEPGSVFIGWDIVVLGRVESGEHFTKGRLHQTWELCRGDDLIWCERSVLDGGSPALQSGAILDGAPVFATMIVAGVQVPDEAMGACRDLGEARADRGVTRLPDVWIARYRGDSATAARTYFANLWHLLRPLLVGRPAVSPRIWAT